MNKYLFLTLLLSVAVLSNAQADTRIPVDIPAPKFDLVEASKDAQKFLAKSNGEKFEVSIVAVEWCKDPAPGCGHLETRIPGDGSIWIVPNQVVPGWAWYVTYLPHFKSKAIQSGQLRVIRVDDEGSVSFLVGVRA
jgi:hypothetical protein